MTNETKKWTMTVKDREAAERIAAAQRKMKRNPTIEVVEGGFLISWDSREVRQ
jgi:hypothetical protein